LLENKQKNEREKQKKTFIITVQYLIILNILKKYNKYFIYQFIHLFCYIL
jgi:hypothetical protein